MPATFIDHSILTNMVAQIHHTTDDVGSEAFQNALEGWQQAQNTMSEVAKALVTHQGQLVETYRDTFSEIALLLTLGSHLKSSINTVTKSDTSATQRLNSILSHNTSQQLRLGYGKQKPFPFIRLENQTLLGQKSDPIATSRTTTFSLNIDSGSIGVSHVQAFQNPFVRHELTAEYLPNAMQNTWELAAVRAVIHGGYEVMQTFADNLFRSFGEEPSPIAQSHHVLFDKQRETLLSGLNLLLSGDSKGDIRMEPEFRLLENEEAVFYARTAKTTNVPTPIPVLFNPTKSLRSLDTDAIYASDLHAALAPIPRHVGESMARVPTAQASFWNFRKPNVFAGAANSYHEHAQLLHFEYAARNPSALQRVHHQLNRTMGLVPVIQNGKR